MKYSPVTFEPTNHIARFIGEINQYWKQKVKEGVPAHEVKNEEFLKIETKLDGQNLTDEDIRPISKLLSWLVANHAIEFKEDFSEVIVFNGEEDEFIPSVLQVRVRDIEPVLFLEKKLFGVSDFQNDSIKNDGSIVRFANMKIFINEDERHRFQDKQRGKFPRMVSIFEVLWKYRLHTTKHGVVGRNEKLTLTQIESKLRNENSPYLKPSFITDMQSYVAKLQGEKKNLPIDFDVKKNNNGEILVQLVVDERSL